MARSSDLISAVALLIIAAFLGWNLRGLPEDVLYYPRFLLILLTLLALYLGGRVFYFRAKNLELTAIDNEVPVGKSTMITLGMTLLYVIMLPYLGFVVCALIFTPSLMFMLGVRSWKALVFVPIVLVSLLYLIFNELLAVILPRFDLW